MQFRETLKFYKKSVFDETTGNYVLGDSFTIDNLDVRVYGTLDKNSAGQVVNAGQVLSVRSRKQFPLNHMVEWNGKRWKIQPSKFTSYGDKRRRHWYSARYIEAGDAQ